MGLIWEMLGAGTNGQFGEDCECMGLLTFGEVGDLYFYHFVTQFVLIVIYCSLADDKDRMLSAREPWLVNAYDF